MRNLRKLTAVVMAIAIVLTSMTSAFAAASDKTFDYEAQAGVLKNLGIWTGNDAGELMLDQQLKRDEGAILVLKTVLGKTNADKDAADLSVLDKFADAAKVPSWAKGWVALAVKEGVLNGGTDNKINADKPLLGKDLASMFMNALGYSAENDYATAVTKLAAKSKGTILTAIAADLNGAELTRDAASAVVYDTLTVTGKDAKQTVIEKFVGDNADLKAIATEAGLIVVNTALAVESASVINLKQVQVVFSGTVDKAKVEDENNYDVFQGTGTTDLIGSATDAAVLGADGKTVTITLGTAFANGSAATVVVKNIATYSNNALSATDSTVPTIVGVAVTGPKQLTVEYSEPIKSTTIDYREFTIDGGNTLVSVATPAAINKVDLTLGVNLTTGEHNIKFEGKYVTDYADYKVAPITKAFTVTADTTAPSATIKSASPTEVVITFNKAMDQDTVKKDNVRFRHTYNNSNYEKKGYTDSTGATPSITFTSSTEMKINWAGAPIPLGATKFYISYADANGDKAKDLWGNVLPEQILDMNITLDTTKPTVNEVKFVDAQTLRIVFSEDVEATSATTSSNYTVKDSAGKLVPLSATPAYYFADTTNKTYNVIELKFNSKALGGGSYSVAVSGVKDRALVNNIMDAYSTTLAINDTVPPEIDTSKIKYTIDNTYAESGVTKPKLTVYVPFSEAMDTTTLVKSNFMIKNGAGSFFGAYTAVRDGDSLVIAPDAKSVTITIYGANGSESWSTPVSVKVGTVKDIKGNGLSGYVAETGAGGAANDTVAITSVEATAKNQIKVTFDGTLSQYAADGYEIYTQEASATKVAIQLGLSSYTINSDGNGVLLFTLGSDLNPNMATTTASIAGAGNAAYQLVYTQPAARQTKSNLGALLSTTGVTSNDPTTKTALTLVDKVAPTVASVNVTKNAITVNFSEPMKYDSFAKTLNGFTVTGGGNDFKVVDMTVTDLGGYVTSVTINGVDFIKDVTSVSYNSAAGITDVNGNKLADFTGKTN